MNDTDILNAAAGAIADAGRRLYARGWLPATSGNLSVRIPGGAAITVSGAHKGKLGPEDIMTLDTRGKATDARRPSAEATLHTQLYTAREEIEAVVHVHSVNATVLSMQAQGDVLLRGYELLKAFAGITTHAAELVVPVFENDQDIPRLARRVGERLGAAGMVHGYLIAGHGLYTWGESMEAALNHAEAFDFLFECELRRQQR